jgi:CRP-like cAMP-binding protein
MSGRLLCVFWTADGKEILFNRIQTSGYFGHLAAIDGGSRSLSVYCQTSCEAVVLSQRDFLKVLDFIPEVSRHIMIDLASLVRSLTLRCYESTSRTVAQRVRAYLADMAMRSGDSFAAGLTIALPSHAEIASSIGVNREAVTRAMSELNRAKVIESSRKCVRVLLPHALVEANCD